MTKNALLISGEAVLSSKSSRDMQVCNHEEADTRIFVHVRDAVEHGAQNVLIRTVDTDVVVIAVVKCSNLCLIRPDVSV